MVFNPNKIFFQLYIQSSLCYRLAVFLKRKCISSMIFTHFTVITKNERSMCVKLICVRQNESVLRFIRCTNITRQNTSNKRHFFKYIQVLFIFLQIVMRHHNIFKQKKIHTFSLSLSLEHFF